MACGEPRSAGAGDDASEFRLDTLTREWVAVSGARQGRPNLPEEGCPFCGGGLEAPEPYEVKAFPNRRPIFGPRGADRARR